MGKRGISSDSLSKLLAECAIGLFAVGHFLPMTIVENHRFTGWKAIRDIVWEGLPRVREHAWTYSLDAEDWLELAFFAFLPLFWLGIAGFFLLARSRPRTAGLIAALSGLCGVASLATVWWLVPQNVSLASGYYEWSASMGLLCAAGFCKLMPVRKQPAT